MPRLLSNEPCEIIFEDRISGDDITLYHRMPSTKEVINYSNDLVKRKGQKLLSKAGDTRQKYGAKILVGFKEGCFETEKGPLSCDQGSENYDENWKEHVIKYAPDIIEALAMHVFERSVTAKSSDDEEGEDTENP